MDRAENDLQSIPVRVDGETLRLLAPAVFLFVLPLAHVTALRSIAFAVSVAWLLWTWRVYPTPGIPLKTPFAAWLVLALLSLIWAIHPAYSLGEIKAEILYGFLSFLIFFKATRSRREIDLWFCTIAASALVVGSFAAMDFLRGLNPYDVGMHGGTLYYAGYLNTVFPVLAAVVLLRAGWFRVFSICLGAFLLFTAFGSTSRAVWLGFLVELAVFGALYVGYMGFRPVVKTIVIATSLSSLVALSAGLLYVTKEKLSLSGGPAAIIAQAVKLDHRPKLWADSIMFIKERPMTGAGFGRMVLGEELVAQQQDRNHSHAHNIFLNYALQLGVLGPFVILLLFFATTREFWRLIKSADRELKVLGIAGVSMVGGVLSQGMVEDIFVRHLAWLFWALVGMTLGYAMNRGGQFPSPARPAAK